MTTLQATEGKWLYNGESFAKTVLTPDPTLWREVTEEYKTANDVQMSEAKTAKLQDCAAYAESLKAVDFHGTDRWLTPNERANYKNALQAMQSKGVPAITIFGATITPEQGLSILEDIEVYAAMVTMTEQGHEAAIKALDDDSLETYDFTVGYPAKLTY